MEKALQKQRVFAASLDKCTTFMLKQKIKGHPRGVPLCGICTKRAE